MEDFDRAGVDGKGRQLWLLLGLFFGRRGGFCGGSLRFEFRKIRRAFGLGLGLGCWEFRATAWVGALWER